MGKILFVSRLTIGALLFSFSGQSFANRSKKPETLFQFWNQTSDVVEIGLGSEEKQPEKYFEVRPDDKMAQEIYAQDKPILVVVNSKKEKFRFGFEIGEGRSIRVNWTQDGSGKPGLEARAFEKNITSQDIIPLP